MRNFILIITCGVGLLFILTLFVFEWFYGIELRTRKVMRMVPVLYYFRNKFFKRLLFKEFGNKKTKT